VSASIHATLDRLNKVLACTKTKWQWHAEDLGDAAALVCSFPAETTNAQGAFITDEPWAEEGGAIVEGADLAYAGGGSDVYIDERGNEVVLQWTKVKQE
jgi:hypothetical protein